MAKDTVLHLIALKALVHCRCIHGFFLVPAIKKMDVSAVIEALQGVIEWLKVHGGALESTYGTCSLNGSGKRPLEHAFPSAEKPAPAKRSRKSGGKYGEAAASDSMSNIAGAPGVAEGINSEEVLSHRTEVAAPQPALQPVDTDAPTKKKPRPVAAKGDKTEETKEDLIKGASAVLSSSTFHVEETPQKHLNAFHIFMQEHRPRFIAENSSLRKSEVYAALQAKWKELDDASKSEYSKRALSLKTLSAAKTEAVPSRHVGVAVKESSENNAPSEGKPANPHPSLKESSDVVKASVGSTLQNEPSVAKARQPKAKTTNTSSATEVSSDVLTAKGDETQVSEPVKKKSKTTIFPRSPRHLKAGSPNSCLGNDDPPPPARRLSAASPERVRSLRPCSSQTNNSLSGAGVSTGDFQDVLTALRELERLAVELYARGLSTRDIEDAFTDETGQRLLSRAAVSKITEKRCAEYEDFCKRDLSEHAVAYLFIDGIAERLRPGQRREAVLAAWGIGEDGRKSLLGLMAGSKEDVETVRAFFQNLRAKGWAIHCSWSATGARDHPGDRGMLPRSARQRCLAYRMRNLAAKVSADPWPEFKARARTCYQAPSRGDRASIGPAAAPIRQRPAQCARLFRGRFRGLHRAPAPAGHAPSFRKDDEPPRTSIHRGTAKAENHSKWLRREAGAQADVRHPHPSRRTMARPALHRVRTRQIAAVKKNSMTEYYASIMPLARSAQPEFPTNPSLDPRRCSARMRQILRPR